LRNVIRRAEQLTRFSVYFSHLFLDCFAVKFRRFLNVKHLQNKTVLDGFKEPILNFESEPKILVNLCQLTPFCMIRAHFMQPGQYVAVKK
jgi:hypothetical protein